MSPFLLPEDASLFPSLLYVLVTQRPSLGSSIREHDRPKIQSCATAQGHPSRSPQGRVDITSQITQSRNANAWNVPGHQRIHYPSQALFGTLENQRKRTGNLFLWNWGRKHRSIQRNASFPIRWKVSQTCVFTGKEKSAQSACFRVGPRDGREKLPQTMQLGPHHGLIYVHA